MAGPASEPRAGEPPPFEIVRPPRQSVPLVFNSPHSGHFYPGSFLALSRLDRRAIRRSEDVLVDVLFSGVTALGAPLMRALYPRAYLDVNREPYELDPKMFVGQLPAFANVRSVRVAGGLGTIPRLVSDTEDIYGAPLAVEEALERINRVYRPYHDALRRLLAETHVLFGCAILVDCHSMPSSLRGLSGRNRPDFVLGDRFGASCMPEVMEAAAAALRQLGYNVCRNKPYAGGFITEHYGRPSQGLHALQVEINRALYMDEERLEPHAGFARLQRDLMRFAEAMTRLGGGEAVREAAE
jgi:N-formylglutamate amidohydrolase